MDKKQKNKKKIIITGVAVVVVLIAAVFVIMMLLSGKQTTAVIDSKEYSVVVTSDEQAQEFVEQFFEVEELYSLQEAYVPEKFNDTYEDYNELQKLQGLDLSEHKSEKCKLYIYKLSDFKIDGKVSYMSILVCDDRVIGGHISTMIKDDVMYTFDGEKYE